MKFIDEKSYEGLISDPGESTMCFFSKEMFMAKVLREPHTAYFSGQGFVEYKFKDAIVYKVTNDDGDDSYSIIWKNNTEEL